MKTIQTTRVSEIINLHGEFVAAFKKTVAAGIRIGELLQQQKTDMEHGQFGRWVDENLPFTQRTAQNYMKLYRDRDRLKSETVSHLTEAYRLLEDPKPLDDLENIKAALEQAGDTDEIRRLRDQAQKIARDATTKLFKAQKNESDLYSFLSNDIYEFTSVGLRRKRRPTKDEWVEYGEILAAVENATIKRGLEIKTRG